MQYDVNFTPLLPHPVVFSLAAFTMFHLCFLFQSTLHKLHAHAH